MSSNRERSTSPAERIEPTTTNAASVHDRDEALEVRGVDGRVELADREHERVSSTTPGETEENEPGRPRRAERVRKPAVARHEDAPLRRSQRPHGVVVGATVGAVDDRDGVVALSAKRFGDAGREVLVDEEAQ